MSRRRVYPLWIFLLLVLFSLTLFESQASSLESQDENTRCTEELTRFRSVHSFPQDRLEPVTYASGYRSLLEIMGRCPHFLSLLRGDFQSLDQWGNPERYSYSFYGVFSPGLLFHARNIADLIYHFTSLDSQSIIEFTAGYGAETVFLHKLFKANGWKWKKYTLVTIDERKPLIQWFLKNNEVSNVDIFSVNEWKEKISGEGEKSSYDVAFLLSVGHNHFLRADQELILHCGICAAKRALMKISPECHHGDIQGLFRNQLVQRLFDKEKKWKEVSCLEPEYGTYRMLIFSEEG